MVSGETGSAAQTLDVVLCKAEESGAAQEGFRDGLCGAAGEQSWLGFPMAW